MTKKINEWIAIRKAQKREKYPEPVAAFGYAIYGSS